MNKIPTVVWVLGAIILGVGFLVLLNANKNKDDLKGATLPVKIEVYSDYNCPHCADFAPFVQDIETTFGDKVEVTRRHLPFLADSSYTLAYAAESARIQEKFLEFDHALFKWATYQSILKGQKDISVVGYEYTDEEKEFFSQDVDVLKLADRLELDREKFQQDMASTTVTDLVRDEKEDVVKRLGTQSTPTVFIYDKEFKMNTFEDLKNRTAEIISSIEGSN